MTAGEVAQMLELVAQLKRRYPGVEILDADVVTTAAGDRRQHVRFSAPLDVLKAHGLVTDAMVEYSRRDARRREPPSPCGDDFHLCEGLDQRSRGWDISFCTWIDGPDPHERSDTLELQRAARKVLRRLVAAP